MLRQTLVSLAFLSRLPVPGFAFRNPRPLSRDVIGFPLAGIVIGLAPAGTLLAARLAGLSGLSAAIMALAVLVWLTGALHEDGLADVADGLGTHRPKERALEIMKDSRIGTYGAMALGLALLLRVSLLADVASLSPGLSALALLGAASASRGLMAAFWASLPPATPDGIAARAGRPSGSNAALSAMLGAMLFAFPLMVAAGPLAGLLPLLLSAGALFLFRRFLLKRIGGVTGDGLGAAQQIAEIALTLGFALAFKAG